MAFESNFHASFNKQNRGEKYVDFIIFLLFFSLPNSIARKSKYTGTMVFY